MNLDLAGRTALITGASKGIGRAAAECLAAEGCALHLAARTAADLTLAAAELRERHQVPVEIHPLDLAISANVTTLAAACPNIDILVNNAGAIPAASITNADETVWRTAWDLKVFGYINLLRAIYPRMAACGGGVIINVIGAGGE
ncbi:MAG: SDR family NAD(P)-dependent oxidoreductase, partial [Gammaproteobacteria bacterium]|nr:SDR family NAD(P)-dependent oxidoreductase [Gammaproteobacteria bacterium]